MTKEVVEKFIQKLRLDQIRLDGDTQVRVVRNEAVVEHYMELRNEGVRLPELLVFHDGTDYWLADGFHRHDAETRRGEVEAECEILKGTQQDAQWAALHANSTHGLQRSRDDIARAVDRALKHSYSAKLSDSAIAKHVGVAPSTVLRHRAKLESTCAIHRLPERLGKDGKMRRLPIRDANEADRRSGYDHEYDLELPPLLPGEAYEAMGENDTFAKIVPSPGSVSHWFLLVRGGGVDQFNMRGLQAESIKHLLAYSDFRRTGPWLSRPAPAELPEWVPTEKERWAAEHHNSEFYSQHGRFPDLNKAEEWPDKLDWSQVEAELIAKRDAELAAQAAS
jgi:hypothetical protein